MSDPSIDFSRIVCVSIATRDIATLLPAYTEGLGLEITHEAQISPRGFGLRWVEVGYQGQTLFELMEPTGDGGPVDRFLQRHPSGGVYQVRFHVDNLDTALQSLQMRGLETIVGKDVPGVPRTGWVHPKSTGSVMFELIEIPNRD